MADQLTVATNLANLLGGTRTTGTANTAALEAVLAQLRQQNSPAGQAANLQGLFQTAAGQIPGLQAAMANAVGARRGSNGTIQAALQRLLSQTTLAAQAQQNQSLNNEAQAAAALANATRGQTQKTDLGAAAKNLLLLQGLSKGKGLFDDNFERLFGSKTSNAGTAGLGNVFSNASSSGAVSDNGAVNQSYVPTFDVSAAFGDSPDAGSFDFSSLFPDGTDFTFAPDGPVDTSGSDFGGGGLMDELASYGVFADGGLVGRDNKQPQGYADGGTVTTNAGGTRRTGNQGEFTLTAPATTQAQNIRATPATPSSTFSGPQTNMDGGVRQANVADPTEGGFANSLRSVLGVAAPVNTALGAVGAPTVPGLGMANTMANVDTNDQAMRAFGIMAASMVNPVVGMLLGAMTPTPALSDAQATRALNSTNPAPGYDPDTAPTDADVDTAGIDDGRSEGNFGGSRGSFGGFRGSFSNAGNTGPGSGFGNGMNGGVNAANGGFIQGPGTGTSDSIPARLSDGEYVIPKDVVDAVGVEFFDMLRQSLHTPANKGR